MKTRLAVDMARAERLHRCFSEIRASSVRQDKLTRALKALTSRSLRAPYCGYSFGSIRRLYYQWLRNPVPEVFLRRYKPGKPRVPAPMIRELMTRLAAQPTRSVNDVVEEMVAAWRRGEGIPGVPSWKGTRGVAPGRFPHSTRTLFRYVGALMPISWAEQRRRRRAALAAIADLDAMIEQHLGPVVSGADHGVQDGPSMPAGSMHPETGNNGC